MPIEIKKRASRRNPQKRCANLISSPRDFLIYDHLLTVKYASTDDLQALTGAELTHLQWRLREMTARRFLIRPEWQSRTVFEKRNNCIYQIGPEALSLMQERGSTRDTPKGSNSGAHDLIASRAYTSLLIGARKQGARFIPWNEFNIEIDDAEPWMFHDVPIKRGKVSLKKDAEADTYPYGIQLANKTYYFRGIEADGNTEPFRRLRSEGQSLEEKLLCDLEIVDSKLYKQRWGTPNCYVMYVFSRLERMYDVMRDFEKMTANADVIGSKYILFGHFPRFDDDVPWPKATGHLFTNPWLRVGGPNFTFQP